MIGTLAASAICPHVLVALVEHEVVADADAVAHRGQNLAGVVGRFAVADLRGVGVEEVGMAAELRHAGFEGVAGARRLVEEQQERRLMRQQQRRLAAVKLLLEVGRRIEQQLQLVIATGPAFRCSLCLSGWPLLTRLIWTITVSRKDAKGQRTQWKTCLSRSLLLCVLQHSIYFLCLNGHFGFVGAAGGEVAVGLGEAGVEGGALHQVLDRLTNKIAQLKF